MKSPSHECQNISWGWRLVNIGSGNGLVPSGSKPLPEPILTQICCHMASLGHNELTHWGRVTTICVSKLTIIGSDNDLSPGRRQAIIWTNAGILLIGTLGTNFSEILSEIHSFSFSKMHLKMSSAKWRLFGLGLNGLKSINPSPQCPHMVSLGHYELIVMTLWYCRHTHKKYPTNILHKRANWNMRCQFSKS